MADVKIRVHASADDSLKSVLKPLEESARGAQRATKGSVSGMSAAWKAELKVIEREATRFAAFMQRTMRQAADYKASRLGQAAKAEFDQSIRNRQAQVKRDMDDFDRRLKQSQQNQRQEAWSRRQMGVEVGRRSVRYLSGAASFASNTTRDIARGIGVDAGITSTVARNVGLEKLAVQISNSAVNSVGVDGVSGTKARVDPNEVQDRIKEVSDKYAFSREDVGLGLQGFTAKTGELRVGMTAMDQLARAAAASGASFEDMLLAAGGISNAMGEVGDTQADVQTRSDRIVRILQRWVHQGKQGAVEIRNLATQSDKMTAVAQFYSGPVDETLVKFGALAQLSRAGGGAFTASQAVNSIAAMTNTLRTNARVRKFREYGINPFEEEGQDKGKIRDPLAVMKASFIAAADKDPTDYKSMWMSILGDRPTLKLKGAFDEAFSGSGGDFDTKVKAGLAAVDREVSKLMGDKMTEEGFQRLYDKDEKESLGLWLGTTAAKGQQAQNKFDDVAAEALKKIIPAMEQMLPTLLKLGKAFGDMLAWAAENPGMAITAAITGSIARAGIEGAIVNAIAGSVTRGGGVGGGGAAAAGGGLFSKVLGNLGAGLAITAAAVSITAMGVELIDQSFKAGEAAREAANQGNVDAATLRANTVLGGASPENLRTLVAQAAELRSRLDAADQGQRLEDEGLQSRLGKGIADFLLPTTGVGQSFDSQERMRAENARREETAAELARTQAAIAAMTQKLGGTLSVNVVNMPSGGVGIDPTGRSQVSSVFPQLGAFWSG